MGWGRYTNTNRNRYVSPQPNLNAARARKAKGAFDDEVNMHMGNVRQATARTTRNNIIDGSSDHNCKTETILELSVEEINVDRNRSTQISHENVEEVKNSRRKQKLPNKMDNEKYRVLVQSDGNKSSNETTTKLVNYIEDSCTDSDKSVEYFASTSLKDKTPNHNNKEEEEYRTSHVFPASKATPRQPLHQSSNFTSSADDQNTSIGFFSSTPKKMNQKSKDQNKHSSADDDSDHSGYSQTSLDKSSNNVKKDNNKESASNKSSFYGSSIKKYGAKNNNRSGVKRLTRLKNEDNKRNKLDDDDQESGSNIEPTKEKKPLKTVKINSKFKGDVDSFYHIKPSHLVVSDFGDDNDE